MCGGGRGERSEAESYTAVKVRLSFLNTKRNGYVQLQFSGEAITVFSLLKQVPSDPVDRIIVLF